MSSGIYQRNKEHIEICRKGGLKSPTKFKKGHKVPKEWKEAFAKTRHHHTKKTKESIKNSMMGSKNHFFGKHHTKKSKEKVSKANKNRVFTKDWIKKIREAKIRYVEKTKFSGMPLYPTVGKYEKQILDTLESCFYPYLILRQYKTNGYFLDGYCPALNLAIEIDEKFHRIEKHLIKDKNKEGEIKDKLNCQFLRIDIGGIK